MLVSKDTACTLGLTLYLLTDRPVLSRSLALSHARLQLHVNWTDSDTATRRLRGFPIPYELASQPRPPRVIADFPVSGPWSKRPALTPNHLNRDQDQRKRRMDLPALGHARSIWRMYLPRSTASSAGNFCIQHLSSLILAPISHLRCRKNPGSPNQKVVLKV